MKEKLTFITASAGSGKTFRLVKEVIDAVTSGRARPGSVIATTFTSSAANEMKERISSAFHQQNLHSEAAQLENDSLISTVHGICFRILGRFAFEAGISPDIRVLDETEAKLLLDRAIDEVVDEEVRQKVYSVASRLGQRNQRTWKWRWRFEVKNIVESARSNDVAFEQLTAMGAASWADMKEVLGPPSEQDLDKLLIGRIDAFLEASKSSTFKNTAAFRTLVEGIKDRLHAANFPWSSWEKLTKERPESKLTPQSDLIVEIASKVQSHPRLHSDLENYINLLFEIARESGVRFAELKRKRGAADFADLEKATLDLLRNNQSVREVLAEEVDLLLVDEFQDTSPIQLALFAELGKLAKQVIWVGDVKQSIYGFRGSDPELVFKAASGAEKRETLEYSWRSLPDIVELNNQMFGPAFENRLGIPANETVITPRREVPAGLPPAVEIAEIGNPETYQNGRPKYLGRLKPSVIADAVADMINTKGQLVVERTPAGQPDKTRPIDSGDIAILTRKGYSSGSVASQLRIRGFDVAMNGPGLLDTPEANLALACLRRWLDPRDSLAAAEIVALEAQNEVEDWLEQRLEYIENLGDGGEFGDPWKLESSPALTALVAAADADELKDLHSPLASFDKAIEAAGVNRIISKWGPGETRASQRLANIEQLRGFIEDYENRAMEFGTPATLNGAFGWLEDLAASDEDIFPKSRSKGAISVGTYHSSKGLEWPVVFLADLSEKPMSRLYNLRVSAGDKTGGELDFAAPLEGRELRLWIHPFGKGFNRGSGHPLDHALEESETGLAALRSDEDELLRLLYVGMTRARDRMIFLHEPASTAVWLNDSLGESKAAEILYRKLTIPITQRIYLHSPGNEMGAAAVAQKSISLPRRIETKTERLLANLAPSSQEPIATATIAQTCEFSGRLKWDGDLSERDLGDAMHRIFAAEVLQSGLDEKARAERIRGILDGFNLAAQFKPKQVVAMVDRYRKFVSDTFSPEREEVEVPFTVTNKEGQIVMGFIDHLLHLPGGQKVILDHKIFPGRKDLRAAEALGYSGQLATYANCIASDGNVTTWIHFATTGAALEVRFG